MLRQGAAGALLDPGLGKTSCCLAMVSILRKKEYMKRALVIAPLRPLYEVWPEEIETWENFNHLKYHIFHGKGRNPDAIPDDTDIVLINPEGLLWLLDEKHPERLKKLGCDVLIVDESTRFKDSGTQRFKKLRRAISTFKRRYILTGSITPNGLLDLFGQIYILDRGNALGAYITHYKRKYFYQPNPMGYDWEPLEGAFETIVKRIDPLVVQMRAEDYLDMPAITYHNVPVTLPDKAMEKYRMMEREFLLQLETGAPLIASNAAVAGGKCRQIANGRCYYEDVERKVEVLHGKKLEALEDLREELQGSPLLVLYEFQHDRDAILERWPQVPFIGSGVPPKKASEIISAFNAGQIPMLMGHPASMGHGLNLQKSCSHVVWYGVTWNFEHYDQAIRRVYRQGQAAHVFVYHIVARGTLDQKVLRVLAEKERSQAQLLNALTAPTAA